MVGRRSACANRLPAQPPNRPRRHQRRCALPRAARGRGGRRHGTDRRHTRGPRRGGILESSRSCDPERKRVRARGRKTGWIPECRLAADFHSHAIGVIGGALYLLDYGDLDRTDSTSSTIARISPRNFEFIASYATELGSSLTVGINYKLVEFRVDCSGDCRDFPHGEGVTNGVDVGGQLAVGADGALRVGIAVRNIGFKLQVNNRDQADALPARLVIGALYRIGLRGDASGGGGDRLDVKLAADVDSPWGTYGESQMRLGVDVGYQRLLRVRWGYAFVRDGVSGPSVGMGLETGTIGVDLARTFLSSADFVADNPTFFSFRLVF